MSGLDIKTAGLKDRFRPAGEISGTVSWTLDRDPDALELRLFWHTESEGFTDVEITDCRRFDRPGRSGERDFSFTLPDSPYSFSGKLFKLRWALELVTLPAGVSHRIPLVVSPAPDEHVHRPEADYG